MESGFLINMFLPGARLMNRSVLLQLFAASLAMLFFVSVANAGFDDSNPSKIILWSGTDLSSTLVTAAPGDTVQLFAMINHNGGNYGHSHGKWVPTVGYHVEAEWDPNAVDGASFNWDNGPGYSGVNGQGATVSIYNDHLYWLLGNANYGAHNMSAWEQSRDNVAGTASWRTLSNGSISVGGYPPYAYIYENSILTSFSFTVQSDVFENVPFTAEMVDGELMAVYESHLGVGFWARSVYDANVQLESWTTTAHDNGTTLRVATPLSSLGGGSAVPEPTAALLLAFGAFGLAVARRRS